MLGGHHLHMSVHYPSVDAGRHGAWAQSGRPAGLPVPRERRSAAHSRKEMVHGTNSDSRPRWNPSFRLNLHWNVSSLTCEFYSRLERRRFCKMLNVYWQFTKVLYLHVVLGLQDLLRVRLHAPCSPHPHHSHSVRYHRVHLLSTQRWRLPMVWVRCCHQILTENVKKKKKICFCLSRQWTSFLAAASTSGYVYLYAIYYFFFKTK